MYLQSVLTLLFMTVSFFSVGVLYAEEPKNLESAKQELIHYHDSGEYNKDLARVSQQAQAYLKTRIEKNKKANKKLAIVLDIDETALSNYANMVKLNFGGTLAEIDEAAGKGLDPVIEPTLKLYQFAKAHHVAVFFITGRRERYLRATEANLEKAGYKEWDGLYLLPNEDHEKSLATFKTAIRKKLVEQGYDIVLTMGDQKVDLSGGFADKGFKLPGPYYLVK